jgi:long-chain fatty acid transport protein
VLDANFRNAWRIALGANYRYSDAWTIKFGVAHDQSPVDNAEKRLVSLPDNNRIWVSLGAQWRPDRTPRVDLGVAHLFINDTRISHNLIAKGKRVGPGRIQRQHLDPGGAILACFLMPPH